MSTIVIMAKIISMAMVYSTVALRQENWKEISTGV
jgi:hypothetical protein